MEKTVQITAIKTAHGMFPPAKSYIGQQQSSSSSFNTDNEIIPLLLTRMVMLSQQDHQQAPHHAASPSPKPVCDKASSRSSAEQVYYSLHARVKKK